MKVIVILPILELLSTYKVFCLQGLSDNSSLDLNPVQMISRHGYICETHYITTEDGYVLTHHRIPYGINDDTTAKRPAVLIMHGMASSSADFVNMGPNRSLAYILADAGYDVWIGNSRGNSFSRNHTTLNPDVNKEQFFNFSWHEIGLYDVSASIDYILNLNGDESLYYIGYSQGTIEFFVLASTRPEYNDKIRIAGLMAPSAFTTHHQDSMKELSKYIDQVEALSNTLGIYEFPWTDVIRRIGMTSCKVPFIFDVCEIILFQIFGGADPQQLDTDILSVFLNNAPSNFAIKEVIHHGQQFKSGGFFLYDYGTKKNMEIYNSKIPPPYNLSKISTPVALYYGKNDAVILPKDVQTLIGKLPNVINDYLVPYDLFNHIDFIIAKDIKKFVYNELVKDMRKY